MVSLIKVNLPQLCIVLRILTSRTSLIHETWLKNQKGMKILLQDSSLIICLKFATVATTLLRKEQRECLASF